MDINNILALVAELSFHYDLLSNAVAIPEKSSILSTPLREIVLFCNYFKYIQIRQISLEETNWRSGILVGLIKH